MLEGPIFWGDLCGRLFCMSLIWDDRKGRPYVDRFTPPHHEWSATVPDLTRTPVVPYLNTPLLQTALHQDRPAYNFCKSLNPGAWFWRLNKYSAHNIPEKSYTG